MFACQQLQQTFSTTQHLPLCRFRRHWSAPNDPQQQVFHCGPHVPESASPSDVMAFRFLYKLMLDELE